jgi:hypothetical protein
MRSTTRLGAFGVNLCRLRHRSAAISRAQAPAIAVTWKKDDFEFLYFAAKTALRNGEVRTENRKSVVD